MIIIKRALRLALLMILIFSAPILIYGQVKEDLLERSIQDFNLQGSSLLDTLEKLATTYHIPIGFEEVVLGRGQPEPKVNLNIQSGTVKEVLNSLTIIDPRYEWKVIDGVINVYPRIKQDSILDAMVDHFEINSESKESIRNALFDLPSVKLIMKNLNFQPFYITTGIGSTPSSINLSLRNVNLRKILDEIAKQSDKKYWFVAGFGDTNEFLIISF